MNVAEQKNFQVAGFTLDVDAGLLHDASGEIALRPKSFDLLGYLLRHAGRVVGKEELLDAVWPNVTVTEDSLTQAISDIRRALADKDQKLVRTIPRRGYLVPAEAIKPSGSESADGALSGGFVPPEAERPSIAVLPFVNMSSDPEQEYFADGLVEDVITNLSKISGLFVIARNSSFVYKGRQVDIRQVARELGVRYVLEGSVRRAANRLRITGQLVEGTGGTHVWADKFEGGGEDVFDLQDRLTESIVGAIEPSMRRAEIERARRKRPDRLDAYDLFLQALPYAYANTPAATDEALRLLAESLRLDPKYPAAHAYAAWSSEQRFFRGGFHPADKSAAIEHARAALRLGTEDPQALSIGAFVYASMTHDFETALGALDRALEMNGNSALAFGFSALVCAYIERYERVSEHALRALRLSPFDSLNYHPYWALACACLFTGRAAEAVSYSTLAIQSNPHFSPLHVFLVVSYANLDNLDAARAAGRRLMEIAPEFTISGFVRKDLFRPHVYQVIVAGLRKAGLPD